MHVEEYLLSPILSIHSVGTTDDATNSWSIQGPRGLRNAAQVTEPRLAFLICHYFPLHFPILGFRPIHLFMIISDIILVLISAIRSSQLFS
jgi:hypothetical protein